MQRLFEAFRHEGRQLYLVGGAIRDRLRGIPERDLADLDFATDALPDESAEILRRHRLGVYEVGKRFGTVGTILFGPKEQGYPKDCQITTFRSREVYSHHSRHPRVSFGSSIEDDLWRRDFSINSIAMGEDGTFVDPYGGREDIERGLLRAVGDPVETLRDDPLRMLRIGRFISTLGYEPEASLAEAAELRADWILEISRERWFIEMNKLLVGRHADRALEFLRTSRLLGLILPEVAALYGFHLSSPTHHKDVWHHTMAVLMSTEAEPVMRWAALLHDIGKIWTRRVDDTGAIHFFRHEEHSALLLEGIAQRFRFGRQMAADIDPLVRHHGRITSYSGEWTDGAIRKLVQLVGSHLDALIAFARIDLTTGMEARKAAALAQVADLEERVRRLSRDQALRPKIPRDLGNAIMEQFSEAPGPAIGGLIQVVSDAITAGDLPAAPTLDECVAWLKSLPETELEKARSLKTS